jgi:hypothetical protein
MKRVISAAFCLLVILSATTLVFAKGATTRGRGWFMLSVATLRTDSAAATRAAGAAST